MDMSMKDFGRLKNLETLLKNLQENMNWEIVDERRRFIRKIYPSIKLAYYARFSPPNIQDVFRTEDIERLAMDYINFVVEDKKYRLELEVFIFFVTCSGYKDKPKLDTDGRPSSRRTTPLHRVAKQNCNIMKNMILLLFEIYNRYDVNYTDESGLSHFHVACMYGLDDEIEKFLESGYDPNCLWPETGDSPLHLYLIGKYQHFCNRRMAKPLMRKSVNLNLANKDGLTFLHLLISKKYDYNMLKPLFEIAEEKQQPLQVDARDKLGNTPLHLAMLDNNKLVTEMLLRRGADPNSANDEGSTSLHLFYTRKIIYEGMGLLKLFFKICDELNHTIQVDAKDKLGRTPLQLAVANLWPDCIDILFERGADLSNFIFPTDSYFAERYKSWPFSVKFFGRLRLASGALAVVEKIEERGYQLKQSDALTIMTFFAEYKLFENSADLTKCWYDDEKFITKAKEIRISPDLSLDEVVRLRPEDAAKLLTYEDYWKFACSSNSIPYWYRCEKEYEKLSVLHLCQKLSRGFFQSWALHIFMELIRDRLPILCCKMIIEQLSNEDLCNICLAAKV